MKYVILNFRTWEHTDGTDDGWVVAYMVADTYDYRTYANECYRIFI